MKLFSALLLLLSFSALAQQPTPTRWHNPLDSGLQTIHNRAFAGQWTADDGYRRIPQSRLQGLTDGVKGQSTHSAGLTLDFYSNAPEIDIRYTTTQASRSMGHMPATGVTGIDLYARDNDGAWHRLSTGTDGRYSLGDTVVFSFRNLIGAPNHDRGLEYRLFLPLYNGVKWLEVGVPDGSSLQWMSPRPEAPIVLYGTSIAQGACASRPGKAWANQLQLALDWPLINLGFSGNGMLAPEVLALMAETPASLYILDCMPNLNLADTAQVEALTVAAVRQLRAASEAPILLVEHSGLDGMDNNLQRRETIDRGNRAERRAYDALQAEGVANVYYLSRQELGVDNDMRVDYIHPDDVGMTRHAQAVEAKVREIMKMPVGTTSATRPVTQRREPPMYEWLERHGDICRYVKEHQPKGVMIGNSITHYWGGEPSSRKKNAPEVWAESLGAQGYANLGCGWDRIENVLWRIYHGELDGYSPERVIVLIGTNNLTFNTPEEVADGLAMVVEAIQARQPQAEVVVLGLLPRRNAEGWIREVNALAEPRVTALGATWLNPGLKMTNEDGTVNLSLFNDGLHPNADGYRVILSSLPQLKPAAIQKP